MPGAAFGRLAGHVLHKLDYNSGTFADGGTYALMGAAALTSGITRMTISLTVMILECTGDMQYVLPLMITVMTARLIGNLFNEGLYDMHINIRNLQYLDEEDCIQFSNLYGVTVADIMTKSPVCLRPIVKAGEACDFLKKYRHNCFPIVLEDENDALGGTISRKALFALLKQKAFGAASSHPGDAATQRRISPMINWSTLEGDFHTFEMSHELPHVSETERSMWIDLRPYIDYAAYSINEHASIQRVYKMFR